MEQLEAEKSYSKLEWFFYIILLPCLFTLILIMIILSFMKVDVITPILEAGNKIPYLEKIIPDPKQPEKEFAVYGETFNVQPSDLAEAENTKLQDQIDKYQQLITEKDEKIKELEEKLKASEERLQVVQGELDQLKADQKASEEEEKKALTKEVSDLYSTMTASKAAPILSNLENQEAVAILAEMDNRKRSQILAKMDPKKAAELSVLLMEGNSGSTQENKTTE